MISQKKCKFFSEIAAEFSNHTSVSEQLTDGEIWLHVEIDIQGVFFKWPPP